MMNSTLLTVQDLIAAYIERDVAKNYDQEIQDYYSRKLVIMERLFGMHFYPAEDSMLFKRATDLARAVDFQEVNPFRFAPGFEPADAFRPNLGFNLHPEPDYEALREEFDAQIESHRLGLRQLYVDIACRIVGQIFHDVMEKTVPVERLRQQLAKSGLPADPPAWRDHETKIELPDDALIEPADGGGDSK